MSPTRTESRLGVLSWGQWRKPEDPLASGAIAGEQAGTRTPVWSAFTQTPLGPLLPVAVAARGSSRGHIGSYAHWAVLSA